MGVVGERNLSSLFGQRSAAKGASSGLFGRRDDDSLTTVGVDFCSSSPLRYSAQREIAQSEDAEFESS
jgi:hypothetical protein